MLNYPLMAKILMEVKRKYYNKLYVAAKSPIAGLNGRLTINSGLMFAKTNFLNSVCF